MIRLSFGLQEKRLFLSLALLLPRTGSFFDTHTHTRVEVVVKCVDYIHTHAPLWHMVCGLCGGSGHNVKNCQIPGAEKYRQPLVSFLPS